MLIPRFSRSFRKQKSPDNIIKEVSIIEEMQAIREMLQWHPAFFAGLQIEFQEEAGRFVFESAHLLGTKPKQIDVLIIKKEKDYQFRLS